MDYKEQRVGKEYETNNFGLITIINYNSACDVDIKFKDGTIIKGVKFSSIKSGSVRNPMHPTVQGIGYFGIGEYNNKKIASKWRAMITRCYSNKSHQKHPTYIDCSVDERWHNFQNYGKWHEDNWKPWMDSKWHLDKDILFKGNKIYSPETCCYIPREINNLFLDNTNKSNIYPTGVYFNRINFCAQICTNKGRKVLCGFATSEEAFNTYKQIKEQYIKEIAEKWKSLISFKTYQNLINYEI